MNYKQLSIDYQNYTDKLSYQGDYTNGHTYSVIYDRLFYQFKSKPINFLEIGLNFGGNIAIALDYFDNIKHYGIDIANYLKPEISTKLQDPNLFTFYQGSFDDERVINEVSKRKYDIILEDGSHLLEHQTKSIDIYLPMLNDGGIMIIEDISEVEHLNTIYSHIDTNKYFTYTIDLRYNKNRWDDLIVIIEHRESIYK